MLVFMTGVVVGLIAGMVVTALIVSAGGDYK